MIWRIVTTYLIFALRTIPFVIQVGFGYRQVTDLILMQHFLIRYRYVKNMVAPDALKVGMTGCIDVKPHIPVINHQGFNRFLHGKQLKCIIDCCPGKCGHLYVQCLINLLSVGMYEILHQIVHNRYPLQGGLDSVAFQIFSRTSIYNHFKIVIITNFKLMQRYGFDFKYPTELTDFFKNFFPVL